MSRRCVILLKICCDGCYGQSPFSFSVRGGFALNYLRVVRGIGCARKPTPYTIYATPFDAEFTIAAAEGVYNAGLYRQYATTLAARGPLSFFFPS
jgi:hypothetical protein